MSKARQQANLSSDGNLFADISNDRVGVGSVVPTHKLHVNGTSKFDDDVKFEGTTAALNIDWDKSANTLNFSDSTKLTLGDGNDLSLYHSSSWNYIQGSASGVNLAIQAKSGENSVIGIPDGKTSLYFNGNEKIETTNTGAKVTGNLEVTGVMTYDDVTSVDSIGIVTARQGIHIGNNPTVAADAALHIELDGTKEYLRLEGDGGTSNAYLEIEAPNNRRKAIIFKSGGTRRGIIGVGDSDESSATSLFFSASTNVGGNSPHMVIDSSGKVGIGEATPTSLLHLKGSAPRITLMDTGGSNDYAKIFSTGGILYFQQRDDSAHGNIIFRTEDSSAAVERVRIDLNGNVNFGTHKSVTLPSGGGIQVYNSSTPRIKLVNDTTGNDSGDGFQLYLSGSGVIFDQKESAEMRFYTAGTERVRITSDGKMGLGTNSPSQLLQIKKDDNATDSAYLSVIAGAGSANAGILLGDAARNDDGFVLYHNGSQYLAFGTQYTERLRIDSGGRILINSTQLLDATAGTVHIDGAGSGGRIALRGTSTSAGAGIGEIFAFWDTNKVAGIIALAGHDTSNKDNGHLTFYTRPDLATGVQERVRIDSSGNLIVNKNNARNHAVIILSKHADGYAKLEFDVGTSQKAYVELDGSEDLVHYGASGVSQLFYTGGSERLRIKSDGKVLIGNGTATGAATLQIQQSSGDMVMVRNHATNYEGLILSVASGEARILASSGGSTARPDITFFAGDNERVRIDTDGRLHIGSSNNTGGNTKLVVGAGNNINTTCLINTADQNIDALTLSNWDGSTTTNKVIMHFDCSGIGGWNIGMPAATDAFVIEDDGGTEKLKVDSSQVYITGTTDGVLNLDTSSSAGAFIRFKRAGTTKSWIGCATGLGGYGDNDDLTLLTTDNLIFATNSAQRMRLTADGDLWIGITSGGDDFHLKKTSGAVIHTIETTATGGEPLYKWIGKSSGGTVRTGMMRYDSGADAHRLISPDAISLQLMTNNAVRLQINADGEIDGSTTGTGACKLLLSNQDHGNNTFNHRGGRVLHSNGGGWDGNGSSDGVDPIIVCSVEERAGNSDIGDACGLYLHSESTDNNDYGPMIAWGSRSNSNNYNSIYGAIVGRRTGQGADSNWNAGEVNIYTNSDGGYMDSTPNLSVKKDGNVLLPRQSCFSATHSNHGNSGYINFNITVVNRGGDFSSGTYTAPWDGCYAFMFYAMAANSSQNIRVTIRINNASHSSGEHYGGVAYNDNGTYNQIVLNTILALSAGDTVRIWWNTNYSSMHEWHCKFSGHLLG